MCTKLIFALPSKGRLREDAATALAAHGLRLSGIENARGYRGGLEGWPEAEIAFLPASEIALRLRRGEVHLGITGEDVVREETGFAAGQVVFLKRLGFGHADVVVAVPECWLDVYTMAGLEEMAQDFRARHHERLRVATKYARLTRFFFARHGITDYRIVESYGATEGAPAAGAADLIVDITTTGSTLRANGLRVLEDGVMLRSEAALVLSCSAPWPESLVAVKDRLAARFGTGTDSGQP